MDDNYEQSSEEKPTCWSRMNCWKKSLAIFGFVILGLIVIFIFIWNGLKITLHVTSDIYDDRADPKILKLPEEDINLKLMAFNIYMLPKLLHPQTNTYLEERAEEILKILGEYDIVLLEESFMFGSSIMTDFAKKARSMYNYSYMKTALRPPYFSRFVIDSGLLLLSKYPIVESDSITYRSGVDFDLFSAKGVIYAKIQISNKKHIHIFGTHAQASYENATEKRFVDTRCDQYRQARELMMSKMSDGMPGILMGDLNVDTKTWEYEDLVKKYVVIPGYNITDLIQKKVQLDYILLFTSDRSYEVTGKGTFDYRRVEGKAYTSLSDHPSVMANLSIPA